MSQDFNEHLKPVFDKLDKHADRITELESTQKLTEHRLDKTDRTLDFVCKTLTETRQEVVTLFTSKINDLSSVVSSIQQVQSEEKGAKAANNRILYLISILPTVVFIVNAILQAKAHG